MTVGAQRLATRLVSAGLAATALTPAAAHAEAPDAAATARQPAAPPTAAAPDGAAKAATPPPAEVPVNPMEPLDVSDPKQPRAIEDVRQRPAVVPKPRARKRARRPADPKSAADDTKPRKRATADRAGEPAAGPSAAALAAIPADAPADVPGYFIDSFRVPVFLLPVYQAAGIQYGVRWEILAAINEIETDYGRNLNVSSAGAQGWMQFMPATWRSYGVDANLDGRADPYNPVDAIFAAARYLQAAGAATDLRKALFAYNHANWYVTSVLRRAQRLAALPTDLVGALTGLAQGRSPVLGKARAAAAAQPGRSLSLRVKDGAVAVAVADGKIVRIGRNARLGRFVQLRDVYGNTYTYGRLGSLAQRYPVLRSARAAAQLAAREQTASAPSRKLTGRDLVAAIEALKALARAADGAAPSTAAPTGSIGVRLAGPLASIDWGAQARVRTVTSAPAPRPRPRPRPRQLMAVTGYDRRLLGGVESERVAYRPLHRGTRVIAGTILGHATSSGRTAHVRFEIRPTGEATPRIDPRPIVAGWKLLQASSPGTPRIQAPATRTAAAAKAGTSIGQVLLLGKGSLQQLVLDNPKITIYPCGREDIGAGRVDRRVLATLQVLAMSGLSPTVSSLQCGHSKMTASGNVSEHWTGNAVDISAINGTPILGNQGPGSITDTTIRRLLTLQGTMRPHQIISLMTFQGAANTMALADHADHIHVGFSPLNAASSLNSRLFDGVLQPQAWHRLIDRLAAIKNPRVSAAPSAAAIPTQPAGP